MSLAALARTLTIATEQLSAYSDSPRLDAELLMSQVLSWSRARLIVERDFMLSDAQQEQFQALCARRRAGEPLAYITGEREFWSLPLSVTPDVLVPRPDTESLVERALHLLEGTNAPRVADLGTGSGAIALALASERPDARITGIDASEAALLVARKNAQLLNLERVHWLCSDWFTQLEGQRFDLLVSNPPYVAEDDPHLQALRQEPRQALVADDDGLADLKQLIREAPAHLVAGGWLVLEHGWQQDLAVRQCLEAQGFAEVATDRDYSGNPRVSFGCWNG